MPTAQLAVTIASLVAGSVCFALYVYAALAAIRARTSALRSDMAARPQAASQPHGISVEDVGRLADALARLTDSLSRASPALTSLIGALVFFAIAAFGSGALHS